MYIQEVDNVYDILWAAGINYGDIHLDWIDPVTGLATVVGEAGIVTATHGLAFDATDTLFLLNRNGPVFSIDTATGEASAELFDTGQTAHHGDPAFAAGSDRVQHG